MAKKLFLCVLIVLCSISLVTAQGQAETASSGSGIQPMTITFSHPDVVDPNQHSQGGALFFKDYIEEKSGGAIKVNIQGGGALGGSAELQEMVMNNTIPNHVSIGHTEGTIAPVFPDIQVLTIPYLFDDVDMALGIMDGPFGDKLFDMLADKTGIRVLGVYDNGFRSLMNNVRPIHTPADVKGLKIRVMSIKSHQAIIQNLGGIPIVVPWSELYTALQTGVVDGCENSPPTLVLGSLHEVNKYLTLDGHVYSQVHVIVNDDWLNGLPAANKKLVEDACAATGIKIRELMLEEQKIALGIIGEQCEIYDPTPAEKAMFREAIQEPVKGLIAELLDTPSLIDEILKYAEEAR